MEGTNQIAEKPFIPEPNAEYDSKKAIEELS
jgi:hypothetical protein